MATLWQYCAVAVSFFGSVVLSVILGDVHLVLQHCNIFFTLFWHNCDVILGIVVLFWIYCGIFETFFSIVLTS